MQRVAIHVSPKLSLYRKCLKIGENPEMRYLTQQVQSTLEITSVAQDTQGPWRGRDSPAGVELSIRPNHTNQSRIYKVYGSEPVSNL